VTAQRSRAHAALGRAICVCRGQLGCSQEELGFRSGLHRTYIGGIERGERNLGYANILKVADALEVDAWELLRFAKEQQS
jgi:transcriptional regulator with XRE-family HTH domain